MKFIITIYCCNYLYGEGIKQLIEQDGLDIDTVTNCSGPEEIIESKPDLIICDANTFHNLLLENSLKQDVRFLLLETGCLPEIENEFLLNLVSKGLVGILPSMTGYSQFIKAIKGVISGELWFERKKLQNIVLSMNSNSAKKESLLTKTEIEIVKMISQGYSNKEIMKKLNGTERSVKSHLNRIYKKTGVSDRLQLAMFAIKKKLFI
ncbi:MAG: response regulator transcription factor [Candidatus Scalindua sediminis]|jgi:DNA-binding NarL/FixJ family response regulator